MKANELRIGNLVDDNGLIETVISDHLINDEHYDGLRGCLPIPLTKEWLLKFGFLHSHSQWYELRSLDLWCDAFNIDLKQGILTATYNNNEEMIVKPMLHVHQLQNLYFALTGNELEIKK